MRIKESHHMGWDMVRRKGFLVTLKLYHFNYHIAALLGDHSIVFLIENFKKNKKK